MGFRVGNYLSVWSTEPSKSGNTTRVRLSSSRKNKMTGEYEQDFSGFCTFIGKAHEAAKSLKAKDRIRILECDVGTTYNKEQQKEYVNYKVFDFEMADSNTSGNTAAKSGGSKKKTAFSVDDGEVDDQDGLPF